jgi:RecB family exonuclease
MARWVEPAVGTVELITAASYCQAWRVAARFVEAHSGGRGMVVLGASKAAAEDFVRTHCGSGLLGVHTMTLTQLAAQCAAAGLARFGLAPVGALGLEAVAARTVFRLRQRGQLGYFTPVGDTPGFVRMAARTLAELRLEGVEPRRLEGAGAPGQALGEMLRVFNEQLLDASLADHATLFGLATAGDSPLLDLPVVVIDAPLRGKHTRDFARAVARRAPAFTVVTLTSDRENTHAWKECLGVRERLLAEVEPGRLGHVRRYLFEAEIPAAPARDDTLELFSAPSELMECVEIARRAQALAAQGVPFDRMAVFIRQVDAYQPLLEEALRRAGVPAYFHHGTARPNESGRAFLALLRCAAEQFSAARFAEYCSLAQVPRLDARGQPVRQPVEPAATQEEIVAALVGAEAADADEEAIESLPAPWKWEELLVEAAVIGGVERWQRRLGGLARELREKQAAAVEESEQAALARQLVQLESLAAFALPLVRLLASLPAEATWGEWLEALRALAETALRHPETVCAVLEELQPMSEVGPIGLEEVYAVLEERLRFLRREPARRRYGQIFVAPLEQARGRWFEVVFVPGLAEGAFPKRASEDPLLLDTFRAALDAGLTVQDDRVARERLLLRCAAAAGNRLVASYPRVDTVQSRPRVPSFYALELLRAAEGRLPDLREFQRQAAAGSPLRLGWPAPADAGVAIDATEYDLAVVEAARQQRVGEARGEARYLMEVNPHLAASLRARWRRWRRAWRPEDGMVFPTAPAAALLARHRLRERAYSATALERFAACPYRFYLHAIYGLEPRGQTAAIEQLDARSRGAIFHDLLSRLVGELESSGLLPLSRQHLEQAMATVDRVVELAAQEWAAELAPAIPRVWQSEMEELRFDLRGWVRHLAGSDWQPVESELEFGNPPVELLGRVKLRGRVDLVERSRSGMLRVTDFKTGRKPDRIPVVLGGGTTLQPALYAMAVAELYEAPVHAGRLFYCTHRGGYEEISIRMTDATSAKLGEALDRIDAAVERGFLPPAPEPDGCNHCEYRPVCGPYEETRAARKEAHALGELIQLRSLR